MGNMTEAEQQLRASLCLGDPFQSCLTMTLDFADVPVKNGVDGPCIGRITNHTIDDDGTITVDMEITKDAYQKIMKDLLKPRYVRFR